MLVFDDFWKQMNMDAVCSVRTPTELGLVDWCLQGHRTF